ncbi:hypothetical protein NY2A_B700L [Paramecium bursaria Chlorella virus NY2A]|uniref:Uncharacterized protein B700L n=1 Tax=Paramecium bursaria Chlorella virus NY2A TaxID=46021 RepID=A7IXM5_PBCVN|nr:hypothetical protein NY2A_B700L [Paramecium bursaria Chlorella virus NY2A]ABT15099.1 hypothetical protein NY2A_B700L [Paramecium bursaria Chlorella virus NY2A]
MNYSVAAFFAILAISVIVWWTRFRSRKEKYMVQPVFTETPELHNVLQMPSEETHDVLAYALGGLN